MDVAIAGGHGQVALHLGRILVAEGHTVRGLIRNPEQSADLEEIGVDPVVHDLEKQDADALAEVITGSDAVVFAAGAGPGSGAARKETMDYGGAVKLMEACQTAGVDRYVMVSAMGTDDPPQDDEVFSVYLRAKARADQDLMKSDLAWTVLRPGGLTNESGTGHVGLARHVDRGQVPREDVAMTVAVILDRPQTVGRIFELVSGDTPIATAIEQATR